jgi:membrane-bound serine protease (ClpP class)
MKEMKRNILLLLLILGAFPNLAQQKKVMLMDIKDEIDPSMKRYVDLAIGHAEKINADLVIIELNTYGGALTDAKDIGDKLMAFKKPIWVFVNPNAASAGALISISCDSIYMSGGASIGAATVVDGEGKKAIDKYQSYMRSYMRTAANHSHRDPKIAEGMMDESFKIDGVKEVGQIITFSTPEAIKNGYCEGEVESVEALLKKYKLDQADITHFKLSAVDAIINFIINPAVSGILIMLILGGLYFEVQAPGLGLPGLIALIAAILYLVPYYLTGLAQNWEVIAFFIGLVLIAMEVFVIPGFGVAGVSGIILTVGSLVLMMLNNNLFDFEFVKIKDILYAVLSAVGGLMGSFALLFFGGAKLANTSAFRAITLSDTQQSSKGYSVNVNKEIMIGKRGVAFTILRPSGRVMIDNQLYDAFSRGGYIEKDTPIEVVNEEGSTLRVKALE